MLVAALLALASPATPAALAGPRAAADVVRRYYALLGTRNYAAAYRLWADDGRASGHSQAAFRRGFARTLTTAATVGPPGEGDAGMGSSYVDVPVTVVARLIDGTRQRFVGSYTLRRINDVDGSTPPQRRWHLASARLRAVPPG